MCWKHARSMMTVQVTRNELGAPDRPPAPADARLPQYAQALAQESVVRTWEFYRRSAVAAQGAAKLLTEVAETAWGSARLLNDKAARNVAANAEATFNVAEACARAASLQEIAALQGDFVRSMLAATSDQAKEFVDLSARAAQHVIETMQGATVRLLRTEL
jgi:hypothetical protein